MEGLIAAAVLVVIAIPISIIYLLIQVSSLKDTLKQLKKKLEHLDSRVTDNTSRYQTHQTSDDNAIDDKENLVNTNPMSPPTGTRSSLIRSSDTESKPDNKTQNAFPINNTADDDAIKLQPQDMLTAEQESLNRDARHQANTRTRSPHQTSPLDRWTEHGIAWVKRYFTEGNLIVRVGILVLFIGVAFLLKYASNNSMLPIELRVAAVALVGVAILIFGWRLRHKKNDYALVLQGGGIGILYLTAFAALKLFNLLPSGFVFLCLLFMVVLSATLAILQNSRALSVLATSGGFLAPVLSSTGDGSHIALFSYYAILNLGILAIAWFRSWRLLNVLGFVFTFVIGLAWGVKSYEPIMFAGVESFLILFFLFYVAIALLFAQRQAPDLRGYVDGTLVFGVPIVAFSIQATLVKGMPFALAFSALFLGFLYLSLATIYQKGLGRFVPDSKLKLLSESFLALGVIFASLTIPFALDGEWIASAWALEGAGILWISVKQNRKYGACFGLALQVLGGIGFLEHSNGISSWPIFNSLWIGATAVAAAGLFSSYYLKIHGAKLFSFLPKLSVPFLIWGLVWWIANGLLEINGFVFVYHQLAAALLFFSITALGLLFLEHRFKWNELAFSIIGLAFTMLALFLYSEPQLLLSVNHPFQVPGKVFHPLANFGWIAWPIAFASLMICLHYRDKPKLEENNQSVNEWVTEAIKPVHLGALWLFTIISVMESAWLIDSIFKLSGAWLLAAFSLPVLIIANAVMRFRPWPVSTHSYLYKNLGVAALVVYLALWSLLANIGGNGSVAPLPYIPLLNPIDILQVMGLVTMVYWWTNYGKAIHTKISSLHAYTAVALVGFFAFNATLIRVLHHWFDVPYILSSIMTSNLTQAVLSVVWTLVGLVVMIIASRKSWREAWIAAAVLLGLTVAKLLAFDLADRDTLITIISFIVVGFLLLVVGYFSPIPPKEKTDIKGSEPTTGQK